MQTEETAFRAKESVNASGLLTGERERRRPLQASIHLER